MERRITLVIDDDRENLKWAQQAYLNGKAVLTSTCENGWETIIEKAEHLYAVLINIEDFERGLTLAILAVEAGAFCVGITSETTPDILNRASFSINGVLVTISKGDKFCLADGRRDWTSLLESLTTKGPIIISVPG